MLPLASGTSSSTILGSKVHFASPAGVATRKRRCQQCPSSLRRQSRVEPPAWASTLRPVSGAWSPNGRGCFDRPMAQVLVLGPFDEAELPGRTRGHRRTLRRQACSSIRDVARISRLPRSSGGLVDAPASNHRMFVPRAARRFFGSVLRPSKVQINSAVAS